MAKTVEELLDIDSVAWKPEDEKSPSPARIIGELIERTTMPGDKYGPYPLLVILPDGTDTAWAVHAFGTVIKGEIAKQDPQVGDKVGIKFLGTPAGKDYKMYKLVTIPGEGVPRAAPAAPVGLPVGTDPAAVAGGTSVPDPFGDEPF